MLMKALSIRQPWATLIVHAGKDIENRNWSTKVRGPFLVHAAKGMTQDEWHGAMEFAVAAGVSKDRLWDLCSPDTMPRGGSVGLAEITDCVESDTSPWFMGDYGFKLTSQRPLPFLPLKGALGFFGVTLPDDYVWANLAFLKAPA